MLKNNNISLDFFERKLKLGSFLKHTKVVGELVSLQSCVGKVFDGIDCNRRMTRWTYLKNIYIEKVYINIVLSLIFVIRLIFLKSAKS